MNKAEIIKNYKKKIENYKKLNKAYYDKNKPLITDAEYDKIKFELIELEKKI